jgi:hypothetical protein
MKQTKETTSERRKDTILNMEKTESRTRNPIKKRTEGLLKEYGLKDEKKGERHEMKCKRFFISK